MSNTLFRRITMQAEKLILNTDESGRLIQQPKLPANAKPEAIFLVLEELPRKNKRQPPPEIACKGKILGDILSPVVPLEDWDAL
jgi:hypothetical protein